MANEKYNINFVKIEIFMSVDNATGQLDQNITNVTLYKFTPNRPPVNRRWITYLTSSKINIDNLNFVSKLEP